MSADREYRTQTKTDKVNIIFAIRRKKENEDKRNEPEIVRREVYRDEGSIKSVLSKCNAPGTYRIYATVNARDCKKARKLLMKKLIDDPENWDYRIDSLWKTCLMQPQCKAEHKFLIDIDTKDINVMSEVGVYIINSDGFIFDVIETPNGFHLITSKFNTKDFTYPNVELHRDAFYFVDKVII